MSVPRPATLPPLDCGSRLPLSVKQPAARRESGARVRDSAHPQRGTETQQHKECGAARWAAQAFAKHQSSPAGSSTLLLPPLHHADGSAPTEFPTRHAASLAKLAGLAFTGSFTR